MDAGSGEDSKKLPFKSGILILYQDIQEATASEPLTLDEEHRMQQSWRQDADKLTFIICRPLETSNRSGLLSLGHSDGQAAMLGDVNMFISFSEDSTHDQPEIIGELELMIAEKDQQRQGFGKAALLMFLAYVTHCQESIIGEFSKTNDASIHIPKFAYLGAKIGKDNLRSLALFENLGFKKTKEEPNYWGEYELRHVNLTSAGVEKMMADCGLQGYVEMDYRI